MEKSIDPGRPSGVHGMGEMKNFHVEKSSVLSPERKKSDQYLIITDIGACQGKKWKCMVMRKKKLV
jgi:hypothetical protein